MNNQITKKPLSPSSSDEWVQDMWHEWRSEDPVLKYVFYKRKIAEIQAIIFYKKWQNESSRENFFVKSSEKVWNILGI